MIRVWEKKFQVAFSTVSEGRVEKKVASSTYKELGYAL